MFLIMLSHGEYDDFVSCPAFAVKDCVEANIIADDINENPNSIYRKKIREMFGMRDDEEFYWDACVDEIEELKL